MTQRDDRLLLGDMLQYARKAHALIEGKEAKDLDPFGTDTLALIRCLQVIGEAAWIIGDGWRSKLPEIPWERIAGMRHRLVHDYARTDLEILWRTATTHVPVLIGQLERALERPNA